MKPIAIDLCHGNGGWTDGFLSEGYRVIGFDVEDIPSYQGLHIKGDVRVLVRDLRDRRHMAGWYGRILEEMTTAAVIVASPPCDGFSRFQMPWTRARNPPQPDLSIWKACVEISIILGIPIVIENVRAAQGWMGRAQWHCGAFYLWGDVPALMPEVFHRKKESFSSTAKRERAMVPIDLARWIAQAYAPVASAAIPSLNRSANTGAPIATGKP